ncbi:BZ3500_MvSof-1268-A1-R1_Chr7-1g09232 [Microbotryum saponariae]|uniref:BZ3500_MvSof-1268-A1-R1_Chr7-1g09232 protein n=1 Tax=Microbotryum saponariae TaxID=289078 RepID=A0A2X0M226_9BASI|nr:BZ3501_MvSof-1269-A2-R1_Chr7-1g08937 [Microbotryum saponariae]SDA03045.1 BZ3500_MvSof-1268-A1-R1_Chr7-1g09232 [Microbotryum saponariae]
MSKATPSLVQQFSQLGSTSSAHQDHSSHASTSASTLTSFRTPVIPHSQPSGLSSSDVSTRAQEGWTPYWGSGTDEDLGRFAAFSTTVGLGAKHQPSPGHDLGAGTQDAMTLDFESSWNTAQPSPAWNDDELYHQSHAKLDSEAGEGRNGWQDGDEIQALLQSGMLNAQLEEGWEQELASEQSRKHHAESTIAKDPTISSAQGQLSPVTQKLVQKVDALELEARLHLQSLLTLTNESGDDTLAIQAYLSQKSYADDVWGLPREIREVLTKVVEEQSQANDSDKNKALQRLNLVLKHLQETTISVSTGKEKTSPTFRGSGAASDDEGDSYGSALQHVAARRSSQLGPKHSSAMSTPPNGLVQDRAHDFTPLHERMAIGGSGYEGR